MASLSVLIPSFSSVDAFSPAARRLLRGASSALALVAYHELGPGCSFPDPMGEELNNRKILFGYLIVVSC